MIEQYRQNKYVSRCPADISCLFPLCSTSCQHSVPSCFRSKPILNFERIYKSFAFISGLIQDYKYISELFRTAITLVLGCKLSEVFSSNCPLLKNIQGKNHISPSCETMWERKQS